MIRQESAYRAFAALMLGIAVHNYSSSGLLLISKADKANTGWIWRLSCLAWLFSVGFLIVQMIILDYLTSPYAVPDWWVGLVVLLNFLFHYLGALFIAWTLLIRLRVFYPNSSLYVISMIVLLVTIFVSRTVSDMTGVYISYTVLQNKYLAYEQHPYFSFCEKVTAVSAIIEAVYSSLGSLGFLNSLADAVQSNKKSFFMNVLVKHEGYRLVLIVVLQSLTGILLLWESIFGRTVITNSALYIPSWTYSIELVAFLELSYVTAKKIMLEQSHTPSYRASSHEKRSKMDSEVHFESGKVSTDYQRPTSPQFIDFESGKKSAELNRMQQERNTPNYNPLSEYNQDLIPNNDSNVYREDSRKYYDYESGKRSADIAREESARRQPLSPKLERAIPQNPYDPLQNYSRDFIMRKDSLATAVPPNGYPTSPILNKERVPSHAYSSSPVSQKNSPEMKAAIPEESEQQSVFTYDYSARRAVAKPEANDHLGSPVPLSPIQQALQRTSSPFASSPQDKPPTLSSIYKDYSYEETFKSAADHSSPRSARIQNHATQSAQAFADGQSSPVSSSPTSPSQNTYDYAKQSIQSSVVAPYRPPSKNAKRNQYQ
ncbi:hypothetical protein HDV01_005282 [Terramyces sp. JEL0728]|nr:hypothetical protein HDV01_005282 [Terramyces sp. JEL0728]